MERLLWVSLGGAIGSGARYLVSSWAIERFGTSFPWGTLAVNLAGSFLLGLLMQLSALVEGFSPALRLALTVGVLGGFTTYSSFNHETLAYAAAGRYGPALGYTAATLAGCLAAGIAGQATARFLAG